ncbi:integral membrane protein [Aspergillus sclerotiicarbonarius CBS 121057]|uniref:Integral membrane protein n=1 Tax=Aspergillus sclerotiicarbonarius (strain CBS 121057 / IBT 28362) TaxID=1448318 RepID=A0A319F3B7_ASPSB|nr:integral membrane protein [Aspergillus sclerotiicarbonarius CBS 121057]
MQLPPPEVLATWPVPNYVDPPTRGHAVNIVNIVLVILAFIVTALRLYTRFKITCTPGLDDALVVIAFAFGIGMCVCTSLATERYGANRHIWDVPLPWIPIITKYNLAFQLTFSLSCSIVKLSVLWFCKRLIGTGSKGLYKLYYIVLIISLVFVALCCIVFLLVSIFQCTPIHAFWDLEPMYPYHCVNYGAAVFSASTVNISTDFLCTILPMPLIWNLKLPARQRLAVISIFGLGIVVNIAGSVRTVYVWKSMMNSYDTTWMGWPILLAGSIEINLAMICASAPALRPLIGYILPHLLPSARGYGSSFGNKSRDQKLWSSTEPSKPSRVSKIEDRQYGYEGDTMVDRMEVMRTVEMETWTENRRPSHNAGNDSKVESNHTRVASPTHHINLKSDGVIYTSPGSEVSSTSLTRDSKGEQAFYDHNNPV